MGRTVLAAIDDARVPGCFTHLAMLAEGRLVAEEAAATAEPAEAELQLLTPLGPPPRWASGALRAECRVLVAAGGQRDHRACRGADVVIEGFTTEQSTPSSATEVLAKIDDRL